MFAQLPVQLSTEAALRQFADEASQKDFRWWFAILFGILITSVTFIVKWLITSLKEQRQSNVEITKEFIGNMKDDRLKMMVLLERVTMVLEKLEEDKRIQSMLGNLTPPKLHSGTNLPRNPSPSELSNG